MNCEYIQNKVNDFFDKKLSEEEQLAFAAHLRSCEKCELLVKQYEKYFELIERSEPGFKPPKDLLDRISDGLMGDKKEELTESTIDKKELDSTIRQAVKTTRKENKTAEKKKFEFHLPRRKIVAGFLIVLGIISVSVLVIMNFSFSNEPWKIDVQNGNYSINGLSNEQHELHKNDVISTEEDGSLRINVPSTSYLNLKSNSQLVISETQDKNNVVTLVNGDLEVETYSSEPYLTIKTEFAELIDKHADYLIEVDDNNTHRIKVKQGIVKFNNASSQIPVGAGYYLELRNGFDLGVPYRLNASPVLIEELEKYLFDSGGLESLQKIISVAVEADAVTLWNLIKRVDKNEIIFIYDKLNMFYPVPEGVSKRLVLNLKQDALDLWWNEIEWQL